MENTQRKGKSSKNTKFKFKSDAIHDASKTPSKDPLAFDGPVTRLRPKKFKQALNSYLEHIMKMASNGAFDDENSLKMVNLIAFQTEAHFQ